MLDEVDRMILRLLLTDARSTYAQLGQAVRLSPPAVHERVKKLERTGVIRRHTIEVNPHILGLDTCAFIRIAIRRIECSDVARALQEFNEVEECHSTAGEDSVLLKVRTTNTAALEALIVRIRQIPGVERTITTVVLLSHFERGTVPSMESDTRTLLPRQ